MRPCSLLLFGMYCLLCPVAHSEEPNAKKAAETATSADGTQILKWKDGKAAVFLLAFDDACPTHLKNVMPELNKRKIPGTFYVITGAGQFKDQKQWAVEAKSPYVVLANHTEKHNGAQTLDEFDTQVANANATIKERTPHLKTDRLISYGKPGGVKWGEGVNDPAMKPIIVKHHCVDRPPFWGAIIHVKTTEDMEQLIDNAIKKGEMAHLDFHGVGGDWLPTPMSFLLITLDYLEKRGDQLWLTDHATYAKYAAERKAATVKVLEQNAKQIKISLTATTDPQYYDEPLSLSTKVPAAWKAVQVKQGTATTTVKPVAGVVMYDALPGTAEIVLTPAS
jgi:hypothetical protein